MRKIDCIHIYTEENILVDGFSRVSDNWLTSVLSMDYDEVRKLSKMINKPVLKFQCSTDGTIDMCLFVNGKITVRFCNDGLDKNKGIFKLPSLIGYDEGNKRKLSSILACKDSEKLIALLEEFLGVGLIKLKASVKRDDALYSEYVKAEKQLTGNNAPIKKELVSEIDGKLFHTPFFAGNLKGYYKPYIYLFGFDKDYDESGLERFYQWLEFKSGNLMPISEEEFSQTEFVERPIERKDSFTYRASKVYFSERAPEAFACKSFKIAQDLYPFDYYNDEVFILTNEKSTLFFADSEFNIIAKQNFKGRPVDYRDGHILTVGAGSFWAYEYNPYDKVCVYKLYED